MQLKLALAAIVMAGIAQTASAASISLTDTVTYAGSSALVTPGIGQTNGITPTVSFGISNAFNGAPIGADLPAALAGTGGPWNFYDDYVFTVAANSTVQSALISFDSGIVGISNLQARIVAVNPPWDPLTNLGAPSSGNTVVNGWTNTNPVAGISTVNLNQTAFGPGTYALQIRGEVNPASLSGSYGGSISFTAPVPLPAALPLMISGLGLLGAARARRRRVEPSAA